ncbi:MAG: hypothetical protein ACRDI3_04330 [Actinomycetota bacterium]
MDPDTYDVVLAGALALNAALGFGYRVYRLTKRGPLGDVIGQAILGIVLAGLAIAVAADLGWARWAALIYGLLFGVAVMPVWVLGVLIPSEPRAPDYAFTVVYWATLAVVIAAALLA